MFEEFRQTVSLVLPVSKTDPSAIGCVRTWGCVCSGEADQACPYQVLLKHVEDIREKSGELAGTLPADLPLYPNARGITVDKFDVVEMVELLAGKLHLPLVGQDGRKAYGGHVFRVSGIAVPVIVLLARWPSDIVMRYLAEAPLLILTDAYKQGGTTVSGTDISDKKLEPSEPIGVAQQEDGDPGVAQVAIEEAAAHAALAEAAAQAAHDESQTLKDRLFTLVTQSLHMPELVGNDSGPGAVHRNLSAFALETPDLRRTACGWR